ncbi:MAG: aldehyde ferredoxin oxidoreductase family protein [Promethearchaeota archaeon]
MSDKKEIEYGYSGVRLNVNLSTGKIEETYLTKDFCKKWIGGYGFGAKILWDELKPGVDPLSPDNIFVWATGPYAGTIIPASSKYGVFAKSPQTGFFGMAISSGSIASQAKRAGVDLIVFKGKSPEPVYLVVDDDNRYLVPCKDSLWGKGCWETEKILKQEFNDQRLAVMSIGPSGEKLSKLACITNDRNRQAGRTGMGAVMGSKNLKAIAFRGIKGIKIFKRAKLYALGKELIVAANGPSSAKYRGLGTAAGVLKYNRLGMMPTYNFREGVFDKIDIINAEVLNNEWLVKKVACSQCPIACDHLAKVPKTHPDYPNLVASVDHEMLYSFGSATGCADWPTIIKCIALCDDLGIDAISGGATVAMACELYDIGLITKKDLGYELPFGSTKNLVRFTEEMCFRKGFAGEIFADGTKLAGERLEKMGRKNASYYGMHIKGLELPAFDIHGMTSFSVGLSVAIRGACHLRNLGYGLDVKGRFNRFGYEEPKMRMIEMALTENDMAYVDSLIICKFARGCYRTNAEVAKTYKLITGFNGTYKTLNKKGEAIVNLSKCFNIREGWTRADDHPPERFFKEPHTIGPTKGFTLNEKGFQTLLSGYYDVRGWDTKTGIPTNEKLEELGLDFVISTLNN